MNLVLCHSFIGCVESQPPLSLSLSLIRSAVIAKPSEKTFEEEFNEYCKDLPPVLPAAALIEILQEMETPQQKLVRLTHHTLCTVATALTLIIAHQSQYVFSVLKERGITSEGVEANSTFASDIADLFLDSDYEALKDVAFDCCVWGRGFAAFLLLMTYAH